MLARKWRPTNFSEVAGQAHVLKSLINALDNQRLHHAYLFAGTRGVGKTTLARILAKCLNCEEGITSKPCGKCNACIGIKDGRFIDLIEVDAASRTKVEDTRELLENVQYSPSNGRFKIYLIDEVHMLSNHSFNALLKTLEEPPPHVKFLFATTDPQKLPVTILSRCLQFNLKELKLETIVSFLISVLEKESIRFDEDGLWHIASAATGSMRDALTLLDQGISYCQGGIDSQGIVEMLGVPEKGQVFTMLQYLAEKKISEMIELSNQISESTPDYGHILESILSALHRVTIAQLIPDSVDNSLGDKEQILNLARIFSSEDIQLYYQIGSKGREELRFATDTKSSFEMLLIRMIIFSPAFGVEDDVSENSNSKKKNNNVIPPIKEDTTEDESSLYRTSSIPTESAIKDPVKTKELTSAEIIAAPKKKYLDNHNDWLSIYYQIEFHGIIRNVMSNTEFVKCNNDAYYFLLDNEVSTIYNEDMLPKISLALGEFLGKSVDVHISLASIEEETPAMKKEREKIEANKHMQDEFERDANVQALVKHFSGKISKESISLIKE